jgi:hypothetical protein
MFEQVDWWIPISAEACHNEDRLMKDHSKFRDDDSSDCWPVIEVTESHKIRSRNM